MRILITGGAGYIGSHMCKCLDRKGYSLIVLDNLIRGHRQAVKWGDFIKGNSGDKKLLKHIFSEYKVDAVIHFAALCYVNESVKEPIKYYFNNVANTINLLESMIESNIKNFIFSSSCSTYGEPKEIPITEEHHQIPINPYGRTKLMVEQILNDFRHAYGLHYISLRYFNAAGADPEGELGEDHRPETHLIPLVLKTALGQRKSIDIYGDNYETFDGTCIRDYIHVNDLVEAHILALEKLFNGVASGIYNLGNGNGYSVKEIIDVARDITGKEIPVSIGKRRSGDPAILISSSEKAIKGLGWNPKFTEVQEIIKTAWEWHKRNPEGYAD